MKFTVVTILPELIEPALSAGVVGRAREAGRLTVSTINPRDFTSDRHRTVDDTPYGGGPGMVMKVEPLLAAITAATQDARIAGPSVEPSATPVEPGATPAEPGATPVEPGATPAEPGATPVDSSVAGAVPPATTAAPPAATAVPPAATAAPPAATAAPSAATAAPSAATAAPPVATAAPSAATAAPSAATAAPPVATAAPPAATAAEASKSRAAVPPQAAAPDSLATAAAAPRAAHRILMTPGGAPLTQARVRELAALSHIVLVCGRYEGVDERVIDLAIDEQISIGDYVLSGGELAALVVIDAVARFVPGVLGEATSVDDESHSAGLLEYPQYTRPLKLAAPGESGEPRSHDVPAILTSGNHAAIAAWRRRHAIERTAARRPDLFAQFRPTPADRKLLPPPLHARTHLALVHHPVVDRTGAVITTALTNFDIHDLARSSLTYGLAGYHIVTPIASQRDKAAHIAKLWIDDAQGEHRARALRLVRTAPSIEAVIEELTAAHALPPTIVATSARAGSFAGALRRTPRELGAEAAADPAPLLILLGTGWGLAEAQIPSVSRMLTPIDGASDWNHLSVRSAGAVLLDRLFGR